MSPTVVPLLVQALLSWLERRPGDANEVVLARSVRAATWVMVALACGACGAPAATVVEREPTPRAPAELATPRVDWQECIRRMRPVARSDGLQELVIDAVARDDDACATEAERRRSWNPRPNFADLYLAAREMSSDPSMMLVGWYSGPDPWSDGDPAPYVIEVERTEGERVWLRSISEPADCAAPGPLPAERLLRTDVISSNPWMDARQFFALPRTESEIEVVVDVILAPSRCWVVRALDDVDALPLAAASRVRVRSALSAVDFGASMIVVFGPEQEWPEQTPLVAAEPVSTWERSVTYQRHDDVIEVHAWRSRGGRGCSPFPRRAPTGPDPPSLLLSPLVSLPRASTRVRVTLEQVPDEPPCA